MARRSTLWRVANASIFPVCASRPTVLPGTADGDVLFAPFQTETSSRTHHPARRIRNVSVRLIYLSPCITNWKSNIENKRQNKLKLCIKSSIASDFGKRKALRIVSQVGTQYAAGCTVQCVADGVLFWRMYGISGTAYADACKKALPIHNHLLL